MYECDQELALATDSFDGRSLSDESEIQEIVRTKVWPFFFNQTRTGSLLRRDYAITDALQRRVAEEMARRFGVTGEIRGGLEYPGTYFVFRIEQVIGDLLAAKDPCLELLVDVERPTARVQTENQKFVAFVAEAQADISNPTMSTVQINAKKQNFEYRKAFEYVLAKSTAAGFGKTLEPVAKPEAPSHVKQFAHMLNAVIHSSGVPKSAAGFVTMRANGTDYRYALSEFQTLSNEAAEFGLIQ